MNTRNRTRSRFDHPVVKKLSADIWQQNVLHKSGKYPKWRILQNGGGKITTSGYACKEDLISSACKHPEKGWLIPEEFIKQVSIEEYNAIKEKVQIQDIPKQYIHEKNVAIKY